VSDKSEADRPLAIVCGSDSSVGSTLTSCLRDEGWRVVTIDAPGAPAHPAANATINGVLADVATWEALAARLETCTAAPLAFIHAISGFAGPDGALAAGAIDAELPVATIVGSAKLGCDHLMPLMCDGGGTIVLLASALAGWDTRADADAYSVSQAGLLALARAMALRGAPASIRVNAVCMGLVASGRDGEPALPDEVRRRIPLGKAADPADVVDAVRFFLSPDAGFITGSALVVDGGQSLQSWSNAPRSPHQEGSRPVAIDPHPNRRPGCPLGDTRPTAAGEGLFRLSRRTGRESQEEDGSRFQGQTVLITGAAGGLGSAAARRFGAEGARLALLDRDDAAVTALAAVLAARGWETLPLVADVTDEEAMAAAIADAEAYFGSIEVLFNNAGVGSRDLTVVGTPPEEWDAVLAINLRGIFLGCKYGVPALIRAGGGAIVNMGSSTARHDTITGGAAYMASKAAVEALTKSLALQVAPFGIRANTIAPGIIETPLSFRQQARGDAQSFFAEFAARIPLVRVGHPDDVAAAVAFLASDQARHVTGATLLIDGGQTLRRWISAPDLTPLPA
jgi:NAD(P)-dependent dehydrogenase (short-subunit alcohol dehydrogenase family)